MTFPRPPLAVAGALVLANFLFPPAAHAPGATVLTGATAPAAAHAVAAVPALALASAPVLPETGIETQAARLVRVVAGDTLMGILVDAGVAPADAQDAITALQPVWNPRDLKVGQEIAMQFAAERLQEMRFAPALDRDVVVARAGDGHFASRAQLHPLTRVPELAVGVIHTSLFDAASEAGVPMSVLADVIHAFSYDVDFQREVHPEDSFEVVFERLHDESGKPVGAGNVVYASMTLSGTRLRLYRYTPSGSFADFFSARGESVRKALLRTPVDGARLSSRFGMRHHPILGYTKMHRGVDFAAPPGTPIMAAGDGVIKSAGYNSSYGNLVVLRHNGTYETAYAHMSYIARGIRLGQHVHQGQVIGYVGATGRATGPHLHYEVRINGAATNPMSVKMQPGQQLAGKELAAFRTVADAVDHQLLALHGQTAVAAVPARQPE
ncbi:MAG TPA: peptidoglycan DD-metalloendopeptidase family protein [Stellaceae bacterium]